MKFIKFSLIQICEKKEDGTINGWWVQDHHGTLETALTKAKATEEINRYAITIQNCDRELTPAQKIEQLEAELARLQVALEATIAEKEKYKRALKIACEVNSDMFATSEEAMIYCIRQAKEASK